MLLHVDGWEDMTMGGKRPKAYMFTNNAGPQFSLLPAAERWDYFILFFNDELLINIKVLKTKLRNYS
jgi:hypothetical protein